MKPQAQFHPVKNRFAFRQVAVSRELEKSANLRLFELLAIAPPGAAGTGVLEKSEQNFRAVVAIHSAFRTFVQEAIGTNPASAIRKALDRLEDALFAWRYGAGAPQAQVASGIAEPTFSRKVESRERLIA